MMASVAAAWQDLEAFSDALGLPSILERVNLLSHVALYTPIDEPC